MEEEFLFNERLIWYKTPIQAFSGRLKISKERVSFEKDMVEPTPYGGAWTKLLSRLKQKVDGDPEILNQPLKSVKFMKGKKMGKKTFLLHIETSDHKVFKFMFDDELMSKVDKLNSK